MNYQNLYSNIKLSIHKNPLVMAGESGTYLYPADYNLQNVGWPIDHLV